MCHNPRVRFPTWLLCCILEWDTFLTTSVKWVPSMLASWLSMDQRPVQGKICLRHGNRRFSKYYLLILLINYICILLIKYCIVKILVLVASSSFSSWKYLKILIPLYLSSFFYTINIVDRYLKKTILHIEVNILHNRSTFRDSNNVHDTKNINIASASYFTK